MEDRARGRRDIAKDYGKVVQEHFGRLQTAMQNPVAISGFLLSKALISYDTHGRLLNSNESPGTKAAIAINDVLAVLKVFNTKQNMTKFCEGLEESGEPALLKVVADMRKAANISKHSGYLDRTEPIPDSRATLTCRYCKIPHLSKPRRMVLSCVFAMLILMSVSFLVCYLVMESFQEEETVTMKRTSSAMNTYLEFLKVTYESRTFPTYFKGLILRHKPSKFINLALVHKEKELTRTRLNDIMLQLHGEVDIIMRAKTNLSIMEVGLIGQRVAKRILVEGAPGVGKTTLAWHLCHMWAKGELFQQWHVVIMIQLRHPKIQHATTLTDLIYHPKLHVSQAVVEDMMKTNGKGFLLIFEGYDELSKEQLSENGIFLRLLQGDELPAATIMVTSRPIASAQLPESFRDHPDLQHIEVLGFQKEDILSYIKESCVNKPDVLESFTSYLSNHPFVYSTMYNPFHCAIITELYILHWEKEDKAFAPKTLTELYEIFTISFIKWELSNSKNFSGLLSAEHITELPQKIYDEVLFLGKIAANGIEQRKYIFDKVSLLYLQGFLQKIEDIYSADKHLFYSFLHLTVQEYFAALYWSHNLSSSQLVEILTRSDLFPIQTFVHGAHMNKKDNEMQSVSHWPVLLFIAGLTKLTNVSTELFELKKKGESNVTAIDFSLCQLLFECQCTQLISVLLTDGRHTPYTNYYNAKSDLESFVLGFCIAHSHPSCLWRIPLVLEEELKMVSMGMRYVQVTTGEGGTIEEIWSFDIHNGILALHPHTRQLYRLRLFNFHDNCAEPEFLEQMPIFYENLHFLTISCNSLQDEHWSWISVLPKLINLVELEIIFINEEDDVIPGPHSPYSYRFKWCPLSKCLLMSLPTIPNTYILSLLLLNRISPILMREKFEYLLLHGFNFTNTATTILTNSLQSSSCSLNILKLTLCTYFSKEAFENFVHVATESKCLRKIIFSCYSMTSTEAILLASALTVVKGTLEEVDLSQEINIDDTGIQKLLESVNYQVKLYLPKTTLSHTFTNTIIEAQNHFNSFELLFSIAVNLSKLFQFSCAIILLTVVYLSFLYYFCSCNP